MKLVGRFCHYWDANPKHQRLAGGKVVSARRRKDGEIAELTVEDVHGVRHRVPRQWFKIMPGVSGFLFRHTVYTIDQMDTLSADG